MKQQGVTLIQMMFALAAATLLTQLGMPAYARLSDDLHRAAAARELAQALRSARSHAQLQHRAVLVQPLDSDWGKGWQIKLESNQQVLREYRPSRPMKIADNARGPVRFSALGVPLNHNHGWLGATLEVCERSSDTSQYRVVLSPSGRISLRTGEPDKGSLCAGP